MWGSSSVSFEPGATCEGTIERIVATAAAEPDERFGTMGEWEVAAFTALDQAGGQSELGFRAAVPGATCPFKGLAPYQPEDAAFFSGREALVDELLARLQSSRTLVSQLTAMPPPVA